MWKPDEVVKEHRCRAYTVWVVLIAAILGYAAYLIYEAVDQRRNPSTAFALSNDLYQFPDVYVCLYNFFGCDNMEWEEECRNSAFEVEEVTGAAFNPGGDDEQEIGVSAAFLDNYGHCMKFNLSAIEFSGDHRDPEDYVLLDMYWNPGGSVPSLTCVSEGERWQPHSESVTVFLRDPDTGDMSAGTQMPYTCITSTVDRHQFNFMGIGLTEKYPLFGPDQRKYKPTTLITSTYKDTVFENVSTPYAYLSLEVAQDVDSLETIEEIDPLEVAEIFGNIGGFWDLLLLLWPIFFVAAAQNSSSPPLRARNFKAKSLNAPVRPRSMGVPSFVDELRPAWDDNSEGGTGRERVASQGTQRNTDPGDSRRKIKRHRDRAGEAC